MNSTIINFTDEDYFEFTEWLRKQCGISIGEGKYYLVKSRLTPLMKKENIISMNELMVKMVTYRNTRLANEVVDLMTTNETLWFRDKHPFQVLEDKILKDHKNNSNFKRFKVWSAACSTGQEAYSIHMTIKKFEEENGRMTGGYEILGTDISDEALSIARHGIYREMEVRRGLDSLTLKKWFREIDDGRYEVNPELKTNVNFKKYNLMDTRWTFGEFDVVFLRNVLIYFTVEEKKRIF